jgi:hypothetical protein
MNTEELVFPRSELFLLDPHQLWSQIDAKQWKKIIGYISYKENIMF